MRFGNVALLTALGFFTITCQGNVDSSNQNHQTSNLGTWTKVVDRSNFGKGIFDIVVKKKAGEKRIAYLDIVSLKICDGCQDDTIVARIPSQDGQSIKVQGWDPLWSSIPFKYELRAQIENYNLLDAAKKYDVSIEVYCRNCRTTTCPDTPCALGQECIDNVCVLACGGPCFPSALCYGNQYGNKEYFDNLDDGTPTGLVRRCSSACKDITAWMEAPEKGAVRCNGECVSVTFNNDNCGFCGNICPQDTICILGKCYACLKDGDCDGDNLLPGLVENSLKVSDCNDRNHFQGPTMPEICGNGVDDNCDGLTDDDSCTYFCIRNGMTTQEKPTDCPADMDCQDFMCVHLRCDCQIDYGADYCNQQRPGTVCNEKNICDLPDTSPCTPNCWGKNCGDCDGCGGLCDGSCQGSNTTCISGKCQCQWASCDSGSNMNCCAQNESCLFEDSIYQCGCSSTQATCNGVCCAPGEVCTSSQTCGTESACIEPGNRCDTGSCCYTGAGAACDPGFHYCCWTSVGHSCNSSLECCGSLLCSNDDPNNRTCYQP